MITEKRIRKIIKEEISRNNMDKTVSGDEKGVLNALKSFGADVDNQQEVQKDFHFLRKLRKRAEESGHNVMKTLISVGIGAAIVALWEGIKGSLK